jgi:hypothetical protein
MVPVQGIDVVMFASVDTKATQFMLLDMSFDVYTHVIFCSHVINYFLFFVPGSLPTRKHIGSCLGLIF